MTLMSPVLSPSLTLVGRTTSFLRYEWLEKMIFQDFSSTSDTSYFLMNLMPFWKFEPSTSKENFRPLRVTWELSLYALYDPRRVFSVMSDVRTQVLKRCRGQLIPPVLRWLLCLLYILQVLALYDAQPVFSVMSDVRTQPLGKAKDKSYLRLHDDFNVLILPGSLSRIWRKTTFLRYEWHENSTLQKMVGTTHTSWFTIILVSLVHSASFSLVRRRVNFPHYGSLDSSIFQRFLGTAEIARFTTISISAAHSVRLRPVKHKTSFLRHEWRENLTPKKVPEVTHTSLFTMILMSPVLSPSVTLVGHTTSFLRYEWLEKSVFQEVPKTSHTFFSTMFLMSFS